MSKISQLHMELLEQCAELGFESLGEAEQAGYGVDWENAKLIPPEEMAHEAWLKDKQHALDVLDCVADVLTEINEGLMKAGDAELVEAWSLAELSREIKGVAEFIQKGEC